MMSSAITIDVPSINPSGIPSLAAPIAKETTAAIKRMTLMGSSKFSIISSYKVLISGGSKKFVPNSACLALIPSLCSSKPLSRSVFNLDASQCKPPNSSIKTLELMIYSGGAVLSLLSDTKSLESNDIRSFKSSGPISKDLVNNGSLLLIRHDF